MFEKHCTIVLRILNDLLYNRLVPYEIGSIIRLWPRDGLFLWGVAWRVLYVFAFVSGVVPNWRIFVCGQMHCVPSRVRPEAKLLRLAGGGRRVRKSAFPVAPDFRRGEGSCVFSLR